MAARKIVMPCANPCQVCNGTGEYVGLNAVERCKQCGGLGNGGRFGLRVSEEDGKFSILVFDRKTGLFFLGCHEADRRRLQTIHELVELANRK